jgi:chemotaxis signal transduction protein
MNTWRIHELAIFSVSALTFGVDASQISEIVTTKNPELLLELDDTCPFLLIRHRQQPLPLFLLAKRFRMPHTPLPPSAPLTFVTFLRDGIPMAGVIDRVEGFVSVSLASLKPVPKIMMRSVQKGCLWGFYDMTDALIPLIDFERIVTDQELALCKAMLSAI